MGKKGPEDLQTHIYWIPESFLFENESTQKYAVVPSSALAEIMLVILKGPVLYHDVQIQLSISGISLSIDLIFAINPWMIQHQVCTLTPYLHTVRLNNPSKVHITNDGIPLLREYSENGQSIHENKSILKWPITLSNHPGLYGFPLPLTGKSA